MRIYGTNWHYRKYKFEAYMKNYLLILPIALLVTYSQVVVKWRAAAMDQLKSLTFIARLLNFASDPAILSAYAAALFASFAWLYVLTKLPLTIAFPIYMGATFALVVISGVLFLSEVMTATKLAAVLLILGGIVLGVYADA